MIPSACDHHRDALADLAERSEPTPAAAAALDHIEHCRACADTLGDLTLTVVALRRMGPETEPGTAWFAWGSGAADRSADEALDRAWARIRDQIERSRRAAREQAWRWRASLGGMLASALVVATLIGPVTLHLGSDDGIAPTTGSDLDVVTWQIEADYVADAHAVINLADPGGTAPRRYPDNLRPGRKEVAPVRSTGLSPDAR
jgi:hypothetical protein